MRNDFEVPIYPYAPPNNNKLPPPVPCPVHPISARTVLADQPALSKYPIPPRRGGHCMCVCVWYGALQIPLRVFLPLPRMATK